jgi:hypothetical protein
MYLDAFRSTLGGGAGGVFGKWHRHRLRHKVNILLRITMCDYSDNFTIKTEQPQGDASFY